MTAMAKTTVQRLVSESKKASQKNSRRAGNFMKIYIENTGMYMTKLRMTLSSVDGSFKTTTLYEEISRFSERFFALKLLVKLRSLHQHRVFCLRSSYF